VEEELDESLYWMELLVETNTMRKERLEKLIRKADELTAIVVACIKRARRKK
jgi:four helix bundle protein